MRLDWRLVVGSARRRFQICSLHVFIRVVSYRRARELWRDGRYFLVVLDGAADLWRRVLELRLRSTSSANQEERRYSKNDKEDDHSDHNAGYGAVAERAR